MIMPKKILCVDDEKDVREVFKEVLTSAGYIVSTAVDGKDCLAKLRDEEFDLILMDMFMPGMSGRETFEKMVNDKKLKKVKVAFLTVAQIGEKSMKELKDLGAADYINKPVANEELIASVKKILDVKSG
jgi:CheY-like chemotaxis protein